MIAPVWVWDMKVPTVIVLYSFENLDIGLTSDKKNIVDSYLWLNN